MTCTSSDFKGRAECGVIIFSRADENTTYPVILCLLEHLNSIIVELSTVVLTIAFEVGQCLSDLSESISLCACLCVSLIKNTN